VEQGLTIADVKDPQQVKIVSSITPPYPFNGYNHSGWTDPSGKYLTFVDEVPKGLPIKLYDISDIRNPEYLVHFDHGTKATPHNIYWKDYLLYVSYYQDGVVVFDMRNPLFPKVIARYDTFLDTLPEAEQGDLRGCWGVYPYLPSGKIIASDRSYGIYVLELDTMSTDPTGQSDVLPEQAVTLYPNPFSRQLYVQVSNIKTLRILSPQGYEIPSTVSAKDETGWVIEASSEEEGFCILEITCDGARYFKKVMKRQNE
jgi:hypothetical protein